MNEPETNISRLISKWACHKLECFGDFVEAYTRKNPDCCYLEPFAGWGSYTCKGTDCVVDGPELRAIRNGFSRCIFVTKEPRDAENLKRLAAPFCSDSVKIVTGNCIREEVLRQAFDLIPRSMASFALVDPPGYSGLRWSLIGKLARHGRDWKGHKIDLLLILPLEMAVLRNLTRRDCEASINRLFGDRKWQQVRQRMTEGKIKKEEARRKLVALFKAGLKDLGYRHVEDLKPARFSNPPYYHIIWASDTRSQLKELDAWGKERYLPCELFHDEKGLSLDD
jgi:three-Cys-motif partner protein